jgi:hypothetical protein
MPQAKQKDLVRIFSQFNIQGALESIDPHHGGHINDTYLGSYRSQNGTRRYILQRINHLVFKEPEKVMENILRVTSYSRERIQSSGGNPDRETLTLVHTREGCPYYQEGPDIWRVYLFIEGARTYEVAQNLGQVYHAARAFGGFQNLLADLPGERLHEAIPGFHHTPNRFTTFTRILSADPSNRAQTVREEIEFVLAREVKAFVVVDLLERGELPERVTHNDTKLNNVLIDDQTGEGICVIDLDTTMPGSSLYDFGDLVRMGTATAGEDETNLSKVTADLRLFEQLARGYLETAGSFLTPTERDLLVFAGQLITYEQVIRFLGDYLNGDSYYKIRYPQHNLDRARNQIKMLAELEQKEPEMAAILNRFLPR